MKQISLETGSLSSRILIKTLKEALRQMNPESLLRYGNSSGTRELRTILAGLHGNFLPENVLITSSAQQALGLLTEVFLKEKKVYIQSPTFAGMLRLMKNIPFTAFEGGVPENICCDAKTAIYFTSNFQNPTGESFSSEEKKRLAKIAKENGTLLIEDNPYDFLYYDGQPPDTVCQSSLANVFYVGTLSKILAPGLRIGYIIAEPDSIEKLKSRKITADFFTSTLSQQIGTACLERIEYLEELRKEFKEKRDFTLTLLDLHLRNCGLASWNNPAGSIFILLKIDSRINAEKIIKRAEDKYGLLLEKDKYTYPDQKSRNTIRLNFVENSKIDLRRGIKKLAKAIKDQMKEE